MRKTASFKLEVHKLRLEGDALLSNPDQEAAFGKFLRRKEMRSSRFRRSFFKPFIAEQIQNFHFRYARFRKRKLYAAGKFLEWDILF